MKTYRACKGIYWCNDKDFILVVDETRRAAFELHSHEAALWRILHQPYGMDETLAFYASLLDLPLEQGRTALLNTVQNWLRAGLLEEVCPG